MFGGGGGEVLVVLCYGGEERGVLEGITSQRWKGSVVLRRILQFIGGPIPI